MKTTSLLEYPREALFIILRMKVLIARGKTNLSLALISWDVLSHITTSLFPSAQQIVKSETNRLPHANAVGR
jgi:hypothetical protein